MAKINILQWLYKHSPANFYSVTDDGCTIIKSINNTFSGYKYNKIFVEEDLNNLRKIIKNFKRFSTISVLMAYFILIYGVVFPNYQILNNLYIKIGLIIFAILLPFLIMAIISKIFEIYLIKSFGNFEKTHFPCKNLIENQSYKEFKFELLKIFILLLTIGGIYLWIGSPYKTSLNLINNGKYNDAIKMTTLWSKIIPIDPHWYSLRGYARFYNGDYDGAIEDYDKAYELRNDEYKSMNFDNKIYIKYFQKKYKSALADFDNLIKNSENEEKDSLLWDKAQFLYHIGKYNDAIKIYNDLIIKSKTDKIYLIENRLYYERAQVYASIGKEKEASADLKTAEELNLEIEYQNSIPEPTILLEEI